MGERRVHELLHAAHHPRHPLRLGAGGLLAHQRLALGLAAQPVSGVTQEAGREHLAAHGHPRGSHLGREAGAVAALKLELENSRGIGFSRIEEVAAQLVVLLAQLRRNDQRAQRLADSLGRRPAQHAFGSRVPRAHHPVAIDGHESIRCAVQHDPRACLVLLEQRLALARVDLLGAHLLQQPSDEEPRHRRRADREQPAHVRARQISGGQHDHVGHRGERDVSNGRGALEEVERVENRPAEEQRVESRSGR